MLKRPALKDRSLKTALNVFFVAFRCFDAGAGPLQPKDNSNLSQVLEHRVHSFSLVDIKTWLIYESGSR